MGESSRKVQKQKRMQKQTEEPADEMMFEEGHMAERGNNTSDILGTTGGSKQSKPKVQEQ